jgi:hypothetical protein
LFERSGIEFEETSIQENGGRFPRRRVEHELGPVLSDGGRSAIDQTPTRSVSSQIDDRSSSGSAPHELQCSIRCIHNVNT